LSIAAALTWAYQFYVPHNFAFATIALWLAALLTLPVLYLTFKASLIMGLLLVPYQIWVTIAATLGLGLFNAKLSRDFAGHAEGHDCFIAFSCKRPIRGEGLKEDCSQPCVGVPSFQVPSLMMTTEYAPS
jgi:hypothetical protein